MDLFKLDHRSKEFRLQYKSTSRAACQILPEVTQQNKTYREGYYYPPVMEHQMEKKTETGEK